MVPPLTYCLELATVPGAYPLASQWVDITDYLIDWDWRYGRDDVIVQTQPGNGGVRLNNVDGDFSPAKVSGLYSAHMDAYRAMRLRCMQADDLKPFTREVADLGPRAWWRFGVPDLGGAITTVEDEADNGYDIVSITGTPDLGEALIPGDPQLTNRLNATDYVTTPNIGGNGTTFTVGLLFQNEAGILGADKVYAIRSHTGTTYGWSIYVDDADLLYYGKLVNAFGATVITPGLTGAGSVLGAFLTYDGATLTLHLAGSGGITSGSTAGAGLAITSNQPIVIGNASPATLMQDVLYWDAALTPAQIDILWDAAIERNCGIFLGYIQAATPKPAMPERTIPVSLIDGTVWLNRSELTYAGGAPTASGTIIQDALDAIDWPARRSTIDSGTTSPDLDAYSGFALPHIQATAGDNEGGLFYFDADGYATFEDADHRTTSVEALTVQAVMTSGDDTDQGELTDLDPPRPASDIINRVTITYAGAGSLTQNDTPSQARYGINGTTIATGLDATEAADRANRLIIQRSNPHDRPTASFIGTGDANLLQQALERRLSHRVTLSDLTGNTGVDTDFIIEAISHRGGESLGAWMDVSWQCSDAAQSFLWELGVSQLGISTVLNTG